MATEDKSTKILKNRLDQEIAKYRIARSNAADLLESFYQKPDEAFEKIKKFYLQNDRDMSVLEKKLNENPDYFGKRNGSMISKDGWRVGAPQRASLAAAAARELAPSLRKVEEAEKKARVLQDTLAGRPTRHDPAKQPAKLPPDKPKEPEKSKEKTLKERADDLVKKFSKKGKDDGPEFHGS